MSRGIGPVLLTHFTPDEADAEVAGESAALTPAGSADEGRSGVLVAPAPGGKAARHRAGRGRRALVLANPRDRSKPKPKPAPIGDTAEQPADTTTELPLLEQLRNTPKNMRILAMTAGAVVLIAVGFGILRPATELAGTASPAAPGSVNGMQPGTLPDAALSGTPTTTVAPPPTTQVQVAAPPPVHHTTTHAAPPPVTTTTSPPAGSGFDEPGQPCGEQGQFGIDSHYHPVECAGDMSGNLTWHEF